MEKQTIRMVAVDLDGTVFNDRKEITPRTRQALARAAAQGVQIVPATGRPLAGVPEVFRQLGAEYALTTNGAAVYRLADGCCVHEDDIPRQIALELVEKLGAFDAMPLVYLNGRGVASRRGMAVVDRLDGVQEMKDYIRRVIQQVDSLADYVRSQPDAIQKITVNFPLDGGVYRDREAVKALGAGYPQLAMVSGGMGNLEFTHITANKGAGLLALGAQLGIRWEEIMACGDSGNDLAMLNTVGLPVAMANAEPEILAAARWVTASNNDDGVADALERFVLT